MRAAILALAALVPTVGLAAPRWQVTPQVELVASVGKQTRVAVSAEVAATGRFDVVPGTATGRVHDVFARARWTPGTGQLQAGGGVRGGVNYGGLVGPLGSWLPGVVVLAELGLVGRRYGGPAALVGALASGGGRDLGRLQVGARLGAVLPLRLDLEAPPESMDGPVDEVELAGRVGVHALSAVSPGTWVPLRSTGDDEGRVD